VHQSRASSGMRPGLLSWSTLIGICAAMGIGLLIGAERERRKDTSPTRSAAGIRTFAVAALLGAVGLTLGGVGLLALAVLVVSAVTLIAYRKTDALDPGLTTEFTLVLTCMLRGMAIRNSRQVWKNISQSCQGRLACDAGNIKTKMPVHSGLSKSPGRRNIGHAARRQLHQHGAIGTTIGTQAGLHLHPVTLPGQ